VGVEGGVAVAVAVAVLLIVATLRKRVAYLRKHFRCLGTRLLEANSTKALNDFVSFFAFPCALLSVLSIFFFVLFSLSFSLVWFSAFECAAPYRVLRCGTFRQWQRQWQSSDFGQNQN